MLPGRLLNSGDIDPVAAPIRSSRNPEVLKFVLEVATQHRGALLAGKEKVEKEIGKQVTRFLSQLECLRDRDDKDDRNIYPGMLLPKRTALSRH